MVNKVLVDYLIEGKKKGFTTDQLKKALQDQGYTISDVNNALLEAMQEKPSFVSSSLFKISLIVILIIIILFGAYFAFSKLNLFSNREISGVKEDYVNNILKEECSGLKGSQYAECSTSTITNIAFNRDNVKLCGFSKFESICID